MNFQAGFLCKSPFTPVTLELFDLLVDCSDVTVEVPFLRESLKTDRANKSWEETLKIITFRNIFCLEKGEGVI